MSSFLSSSSSLSSSVACQPGAGGWRRSSGPYELSLSEMGKLWPVLVVAAKVFRLRVCHFDAVIRVALVRLASRLLPAACRPKAVISDSPCHC